MASKHYNKDVRLIKTTDPNGNFVVSSCSNDTTFEPEGTLTFNNNNGVLSWNSGDITHLNFTSDEFMIMFDAESNMITLTAGEKSIYYDLDVLKEIIQKQGLTVQEMDTILENNENNNEKETNKNGKEEDK